MRTQALALSLIVCGLVAKAVNAADPAAAAAPVAIPFSKANPGYTPPPGWQNLPVVSGKKLTTYTVVTDGGRHVIEANSVDSASALMAKGDSVDIAATPGVTWRWKVDKAIPGADNRVSDKEDSPARLVFFFDGDKSTLPFGDRAAITLAKVGGEDLPYATLMYIWSNDAAPGSVIQNPHTDRVQMLVVAGGDGSLGKWQTFSRNLAADYERIYQEKPGKLLGYGIFTDSDNTHASAHAWYADIRFGPAK
ncbi:DUF3047 domain-containing protein [Pandoraea communis]|uniref:DUF3047 domain-containing protein n=1 Tax=Pandoraea communis TaxID=2508297 RepID=A0A5E4WMD4_9BURK|nr:DUF3047 domain-containing protein [Pandoraea communis]MDM8355979.1 DUF3047 domain-containing protein [Pandoraea communis]VVE25303.1 hypothetical protein PCO31111_03373 [Pandoraea communis]